VESVQWVLGGLRKGMQVPEHRARKVAFSKSRRADLATTDFEPAYSNVDCKSKLIENR
jgi:hypothetical protein